MNDSHRVDALAIISFIEQLTRETIAHNNESRHPRLHYLLLPFSWILPLARKYGEEGGQAGPEHVSDFLSHLEQLSLELRFGAPGKPSTFVSLLHAPADISHAGRWHIQGKNGSGSTVDLMNLRL